MDVENTLLTESTLRGASGHAELALLWVFPPASRPCRLTEARHVIGRDPGCDIRIESEKVSRRHAEIYRQGPIHAIRDLGSTNGVSIDGRQLTHAPLAPGQVLRIGDFVGCILALAAGEAGDWLRFGEIAPGLFGGARLAASLQSLKRIAQSDLPVVIQSETGTGKELIARAVHIWSNRRGRFYALNCAALPSAMVEGELFGYRKGAFTGALQHHVGHLRAAHGGTLFLDEIADLPLEVQAKLLRALQEREVLPLGENHPVPIDVRVICACQTPLQEAVERAEFRADLLARVSGFTCLLPPLRSRREDIAALFLTFLSRFSGGRPPAVKARLIERLCLYDWPENVRELELETKRVMVLHGHETTLRPSHLADQLKGPVANGIDERDSTRHGDRRRYELTRLKAALRHTDGNVSRAAAKLGISRQRAYRLMSGSSVEQLLTATPINHNATGAHDFVES